MGKPATSYIVVSATEYIGCKKQTEGSETSQYLQEQKSNEIP